MAGRKKLFRTAITEKIQKTTDENEFPVYFFIGLNIDNIPGPQHLDKFVYWAADVNNKIFDPYKIIGYEITKDNQMIFILKHENNATYNKYQNELVLIPEDLITQSIIDKFSPHREFLKEYRKRKKNK
jgi:hypothetical protein